MADEEKNTSLEIKTEVSKDVNSLVTDSTISSYNQRIRNYLGIRQQYELDKPITLKLTDKENLTITKTKIYDLIKIASESQIIERHTPTQIYCLESLETCLSTYLNYAETLETGFKGQEQGFINAYSLFRGAVLARDQLRNSCTAKYSDNPGKSEIILEKKPAEIIYDAVKIIFKVIENAYHKHNGIKDELLIQAFDLFYTQIINQCICMEPSYKELLKKTELDKPHELKGIVFNGFKARDNKQKKLALPDVTLEMIVGNEEFIKRGKRLVKNILSFSFDAPDGGTNPKMPFPQLLMVYGSPGTGKTITAYALLNHFASIAEKNKIPCLTKVIRKSDWTSSYQYASAKNLVNIFLEIFNFDGLTGIYWPDFDTAFQARNSPDIRAEEKDNLSVLFGLLDGTIGPRNGKWFIILDANYLDPKNVDEASFSRILEDKVEVKGPETQEQYIKLLRDILLKNNKQFLELKKEDWKNFGELCKKYELSGRAIEKIALQTSAHISEFEEPEGFFSMTHEEKMKIIKEKSQKASPEWIMSTVEDYYSFQKNRDENEAIKKSEERLKNLLEQLSKKS